MAVAIITYLLVGLIFIGIAIPLVQNKIKPNSIYGFRTRKTLSDPKIWYAANAYGGRWMLAVGVIFVVSASGFALVPLIPIETYILGTIVAIFVACIASGIACFRYISSL